MKALSIYPEPVMEKILTCTVLLDRGIIGHQILSIGVPEYASVQQPQIA